MPQNYTICDWYFFLTLKSFSIIYSSMKTLNIVSYCICKVYIRLSWLVVYGVGQLTKLSCLVVMDRDNWSKRISTFSIRYAWQNYSENHLKGKIRLRKHKLTTTSGVHSRQVNQFVFVFFKLVFTSCKAAQPLQGMELQEKKTKKD